MNFDSIEGLTEEQILELYDIIADARCKGSTPYYSICGGFNANICGRSGKFVDDIVTVIVPIPIRVPHVQLLVIIQDITALALKQDWL